MSGFQPETSIWLVPHRLQHGRLIPLSSSNTTTFAYHPIPQQNYVYAYPVPDPHYHDHYSSYAYRGIPVRFANTFNYSRSFSFHSTEYVDGVAISNPANTYTPANQEYVRNALEEFINDRLNRINQNQNQSVEYVDDVAIINPAYYNTYTPAYNTAEFEELLNDRLNRINQNHNQSNYEYVDDAATAHNTYTPPNQETVQNDDQVNRNWNRGRNGMNGHGSGLSEERIRSHLRVETHHAAVGKSTMSDDDGGCCCIICLDGYEENVKIGRLENCGHRYHWECIKKWLLAKNVCPICRSTAI